MKKILITALTIVSMVFASYAGNVGTPLSTHSGDITIEKDGPHTKQYRDLKEVLDRYEGDIKGAASCDDLLEAEDSFFSSILIMQFDSEYDYDESELMTDEESLELSEQGERIDQLIAQKMEHFDCEFEEDDPELIPTSSEEWDEIIIEYEALLAQLEALRKQNLDAEKNLSKFLEITQEHMELITRIDNSDTSEITETQNHRLTQINDRIEVLVKEMGLIDDDD